MLCVRAVFQNCCSTARQNVYFTPSCLRLLPLPFALISLPADNHLSVTVVGKKSTRFSTFGSPHCLASVLVLSLIEADTFWEEVCLLLSKASQCSSHPFPASQGLCSFSCVFIITFSFELFLLA